MPVYRRSVISDLIGTDIALKKVGEFRVNVTPTGWRRVFFIRDREISQYFCAGTPKFKLNIEYMGNNPFSYTIFERKPHIEEIFSETNISAKKYSRTFQLPYLEDSGEYLYSINISSGVYRQECVANIIQFRTFDFDALVQRIALLLLGAGIGGLITWLSVR